VRVVDLIWVRARAAVGTSYIVGEGVWEQREVAGHYPCWTGMASLGLQFAFSVRAVWLFLVRFLDTILAPIVSPLYAF